VGYEDYTVQITLPEGTKRVIQDIPLTVSYVKGDEIVIVGERQGQAKALSIQRSSANIKNVVAQEQMQRFPDLNTAEVIQRLPAISIERDQGEGRYILIRGTEPRLSSTTINGSRIATPEDEGRFVGLDVIPANQLASIEVTKALTPDMDGDAIGGAVNLITKSAFDYNRRVFNIVAGAGYGALRGRPFYQGDLTFADRFGEKKNIGFTFSGSYHTFDRGSENNEMEWGSVETIGGQEIPWALEELQLRDYWNVNRDRIGLSSALEYRLNPNNQFYLRGMYNHRKDFETRHVFEIGADEYVSSTELTGAEIARELKGRTETQIIYNIAGGGEHQLNKLGLNYELAYNYGEEEKPKELVSSFELDETADLILDLSDTDTPGYTITNLSSGYELNANNYVLDEIEHSDQLTTDKNIMAKLNLKYPYGLGANKGEFKVGGKLHMKERDAKDDVTFYSWEGTNDILLTPFVSDDNNDNFMDGKYQIGPMPDAGKLEAFWDHYKDGNLEGEFSNEDSDPATYTAAEDIYAYYAMATLNVGNALFLGGLRQEFTKIEYTGNTVVFDSDGDYESTQKVSNDSSYSNLLPSFHIRYMVNPRFNIRGAYSRSIARPNYIDLVPYALIFREDEEIERGNPSLKTTTANNFDLLAEYYMAGIGILSGGVFYKSLNDIIFMSTYEETGGPYDEFEVTQPVNGEKATLIGVEVNWQQQFTFLPGFWSGFGIYANYTYTDSKADLIGRDDTVLPGQAGNVGNLALAYEKYGFQGRLSFAYYGEYIYEVGESPEEDIYYDNNLRIDFNASQQITQYLQAYLQFVNLSDTPLRYYIGDTNRPIQREFYSWWTQLGLRFAL
jgi:TonB-dependent receptor